MIALRSLMSNSLFPGSNIAIQQTRNTFVLKRKTPVRLYKKGGAPPRLRSRHFEYQLVEDTNLIKQPDLKVILKQFVDGYGRPGDVLSLRPTKAYKEFLVPGIAVYASPENLLKYKVDESKPQTEDALSSPFVQRTIDRLTRMVLNITMSKTEPWTLEPWHVKASFRKSGFVVPEYAIEMPPVQIKGPDLKLQEKEFYVTVTINKREKVNVRCRIHHWGTGLEKLPYEDMHWKKPREALIPEQAAVLDKMPLKQ